MRKYAALTVLFICFCLSFPIANVALSGDESNKSEQGADKKEALPLLVLSSGEHEKAAAAFQESFSGEVRVIVLDDDEKEKAEKIEVLKSAVPPLAVVMGNEAGRAVKKHLAEVPLVYASMQEAGELSFTEQKAYGIYHEPSPRDQLEAMRKVFPKSKNLVLLYSPHYSQEKEARLKRLARARGFDLTIASCKDVQEVPQQVKSLMPQADLVWVLTDSRVLGPHNNRFIVMQSMSAKVPVFCGDARLGRSGAVAALVPDPENVGKLAAQKAEEIMKGRTSGDLTYPEGRLIINRKTAEVVEVEIAPHILEIAVQVIE